MDKDGTPRDADVPVLKPSLPSKPNDDERGEGEDEVAGDALDRVR